MGRCLMYVLNSEMGNGILLPLTATTRYGAITEAPPMEIIFCCFSAHDAAVYEKLLS